MDEGSKINSLLMQVEKLKQENAMLRRDFSSLAKGNTVSVPEAMKPLFDFAQKNVGDYFRELKMDPTSGTIEINDQRYILIRASALSIDFLTTFQKLYADRGESEALIIGKNFLFDISHVIGMNDAKNFHTKMHLTDPIAKLSAGPVHFAYSGWAYVDILPESNPSADENYYLIYRHPFSFESDSWIRAGKKSDLPVCIMNSGYSSGWCEESFGMPLTAVEVTCKAKGDEHCTFIMSPPHKIQAHLERYTSSAENNSNKKIKYEIPTFFERKKVEGIIKQKSEELTRSNEELEQFAYLSSHDLQTPLLTISNFVGLLEKTYSGKVDENTKIYFKFILTATSKMQNMIKDLQEFSRVGKNISFTAVDCNKILKETIDDLGLFIKESNAKITSAILPMLKGDSIRLKQLFRNLIGNAIKFRKKNSTAEVTITVEEKSTEYLFGVKDNGIGIEEQHLNKLFSIFQRLHSDDEYPGTGIGLAICKKIVDLHGGKIWVESKLGEGSTFYFSIPKII
ncbi:MAG: ATP-binding protein [Bacteroidota bacterium]|nr:ATP-binding protein [Bacteroidota bacterium]